MSVSTYVQGFRSSNDATYQKHANVLRACIEAEISELPKETATYFNSKYPDKCLLEEALSVDIKSEEWEDDTRMGLTIKVSDIPKGVDTIKFTTSF